MEEKLEEQTQDRLTKSEAKSKARENMDFAAALIAIANGWSGIESHKAAYKADATEEVKSELGFAKWMTKNTSPYARFNLVHGLLTFKVLPPYGEEGEPSNSSEFINF